MQAPRRELPFLLQAGSHALLAPGVFATALLATPTQLYVGSEDQGVLVIPLEGRRPNPNLGPGTQLAEVRQLFTSGGDVFAVARDGLYRMDPHAFGWQRVLEAGSAVLSDRNISALAADASGPLWVGYFDRGLDLLTTDNGRAKHIEDEHVFCVNRIFPDSKSGAIDVATANGLVRFDNSGSEQQVLTRSDGLIADHVTDIVSYRDGLALATPARPHLPRRQRRAQIFANHTDGIEEDSRFPRCPVMPRSPISLHGMGPIRLPAVILEMEAGLGNRQPAQTAIH